jgi:hypothetical protein
VSPLTAISLVTGQVRCNAEGCLAWRGNSGDLRLLAAHNGPVGFDVDGFVRDGYVAVRGAFDAATAAVCREMIWAALRERGVREDGPAAWPPVAEISCLEGEPFAAAATSPARAAAYDELIGPGRRTPRVNVSGAVAVRFPSEDRANAGYHVEGSYEGPGGYWVNVRSRARGLLALLLFTGVGPDDAPTRLVCGSHLHVPEFLAPYGEAGTSADAEFWRPSVLCRPGCLLVPSVRGAYRDLAAPGHRAADDRPAGGARPRRIRAGRVLPILAGGPGHRGGAGESRAERSQARITRAQYGGAEPAGMRVQREVRAVSVRSP